MCEGDCSRQFHLECLGLTSLPEGKFTCLECRNGEWPHLPRHVRAAGLLPSAALSLGNHPCFSCKSAGQEVTRCSVLGCGCYYHEDCVRKLPGTSISSDGGFCCPQHSCSTCCLERDLQRASKGTNSPRRVFLASLISCLTLRRRVGALRCCYISRK